MGVTGLWMLLAAGGREVSIESLAGQTLAVDASIWLTQFVKAMRDPEDGSMLRNAHLLGTFQRVAKLLFHGIRPVFVFDGDTPAIKLRTLQRRRARREKNQLSLTQTAQKLLLRQLERRAKQTVAAPPAPEIIEVDEEEEKAPYEASPERVSSDNEDNVMAQWRDQQEHVEAFQRERRQEARDKFLTLAGKPEEYSLAQIQTFLKASRFKQDLKQQAAVANASEVGRRIASEADRRYILTTDDDVRPVQRPAPVASEAQLLDASDSTVGLFSEYVQKQSQSQAATRQPKTLADDADDVVAIDAYGAPLVLEAKHPKWFRSKPARDIEWRQTVDGGLVATFDPSKVALSAEEAKILPPSLFDAAPEDIKPPAEEVVEWGDEVDEKEALGSDSDIEWEDVTPTVAEPTPTPVAPVASTAGPAVIDLVDLDASASQPERSATEWKDVVPASEEQQAASDASAAAAEVIEVDSDIEWQDVVTAAPATEPEPAAVPSPARQEKTPAASVWNVVATPPSSPILKDDARMVELWDADEDVVEHRVSRALLAEEEEVVALGLANDDDALQAVMATASNLTHWAAGAVKRAIRDHQQKHGPARDSPRADDATPRYLSRSVAAPMVESVVTAEVAPVAESVAFSRVEDDGGESDVQLRRARNQQMRDVDGVTDEMQNDVMELLRLFGVPFIVAPMEAEAQCATLEQLGLVTGIITDDSDIFAFGGKKVYKNMFKTSKFVEAFYMEDIERELGLNQESMIALALLLGSDYTDGIHGVGVVNATEIVHAFPGLDGLREFKAWVRDFDLQAQLQPPPKLSEAEVKALDPRARFQHTHHKVRRNWTIADAFPNAHVVKAYREPETDRSDARFSWATPDLASLRVFCGRTFGWPIEKVNATLLPIVQAATRGWFETQTRIDSYFTSYKDDVKYAKIRSKRLQAVVQDIQEAQHKTRPKKLKKSAA
ncbi:DNA repair protein [Achlya hypogyna]|uniref:DNA repair protein n=1 Tax=Achlya hypogyna TaxID=1202772 RepID=A0A1V9YEL5_ACHHY|nr:DNA repair protein [Achlya hypogyna]